MSETPAELARTAADAVNKLNHATFAPLADGWDQPADAYDVIGGLDRLSGGLPQAMNQVWELLVRNAQDSDLRSTGDVTADTAAARDALTDAIAAAHQLTAALGRAHSASSSLYVDAD